MNGRNREEDRAGLRFLVKTGEPLQVEQDLPCPSERYLFPEICKRFFLNFFFSGEYCELSVPKAGAEFHGVSLEKSCFVQASPRSTLPFSDIVQLHEPCSLCFVMDQAAFIRAECGARRQT